MIIRIALLNYLRTNRISEFKTCLQYCFDQKLDILQKHDNKEMKGKNEWNDEYIIEQDIELKYNFSQERIDHILEVKEYLNNLNASNRTNNLNRNVKKSYKNETKVDSNVLIAGAGAVVTLIGIVTVKPIVIGAGVVVTAFGIVRKINSNN